MQLSMETRPELPINDPWELGSLSGAIELSNRSHGWKERLLHRVNPPHMSVQVYGQAMHGFDTDSCTTVVSTLMINFSRESLSNVSGPGIICCVECVFDP